MGLVQTVAPALPISVEECKMHLHLTPDMTDDDADIRIMIQDATEYVETFLRRQLMTATYVLYLDRFPYLTVTDPANASSTSIDNASFYYGSPDRYAIWTPRPPLQSVTSIVYDVSGTPTTLATTSYRVDSNGFVGRITPVYGSFWPNTTVQTNSVAVTYVAGYTSTTLIPGMVKRAIKILVSKMYNGLFQESMPEDIKWLLYPYRVLDERTLEYA